VRQAVDPLGQTFQAAVAETAVDCASVHPSLQKLFTRYAAPLSLSDDADPSVGTHRRTDAHADITEERDRPIR
jgi:hypothetical protein